MNRIEMGFFGDEQVLKNLWLKKELLEAGDPRHTDIKSVLILPGGGQCGVLQGGFVCGVEAKGLVQSFDEIVGVSTGAGVAWYTVPEDTQRGVRIYYEENVRDKFVNWAGRPLEAMGIRQLERVFRYEKPIDMQKFMTSRPNLKVGVTNRHSAQGKFIDVKSQPDPLDAVVASFSVPYLGKYKPRIDNGDWIDGTIANPLPVNYVVDNLPATDILVVLNHPVDRPSDPIMRLAMMLSRGGKVGPTLLRAISTIDQRYNQELEKLRNFRPERIRIGVIYPKKSPISVFSMDPVLLKEGKEAAEEFTINLLSGVSR